MTGSTNGVPNPTKEDLKAIKVPADIAEHNPSAGAYRRGVWAKKQGASMAACPYSDAPGTKGMRWREIWMRGFNAAVKG